jgi:uncharacterized protein (TIGR03067 family)
MNNTLKRAPGFTALSLLMPCVLLGLLAGCTTHPPIASELQPLQGTWEGVMVGQEKDGKITITITGNSLHFHRDTNFWFETTFTLPGSTDPKQLHATIKDCADKDSIGKVVLAIFKIEDGTLTLAGIRTPDSAPEPPINFDSENTMSGRFELRKVHPQKKNAKSPTSKVTSVRRTLGPQGGGLVIIT